jgi:hypothetical protein
MAVAINDILPQWLQQRLLSLEQVDLQHEDMFTGAHQGFLQAHFPPHDGFMITHTGRTRALVFTEPSGCVYSSSTSDQLSPVLILPPFSITRILVAFGCFFFFRSSVKHLFL